MKTKILALLLAALMLFSMVACTTNPTDDPETKPSSGNTETDPSTGDTPADTGDKETNPEETDPVVVNPLEKIPAGTNFGNEEFTIWMRSGRYIEAIGANKIESTATSLERAIYERTMNIQSQYGVILDLKAVSSIGNDLAAQAKVGTDPFEFGGDHGRYGWAYAINDYLYLWNDLEYVDLSADYWAQDAVEEWSTPGGNVYLLTGDLTHWNIGSAFVMFFNQDVFDLVDGLTSPYDLVRDGKWFYSTFEEYATTLYSNMDTDGSGDIASDSFGYATGLYRGPISIIPSTGIKLIEKDENSATGYKINASKDKVVTAVGDLAEFLLNSGVCKYYPSSPAYGDMETAFMANRIAFLDQEVSTAQKFTQKGTNFGIVPWPKFDKRVDGYKSNVNAGCDAFFVPKNTSSENAKRISVVLEALAYYGQRDVLSLYYDTILSYQYMRNEESIEMLGIVKENLVYDFHYWFSASIRDIGSAVISDGSYTSLSTLYEKEKTKVEAELAQWAALDYAEE
ncbi:MAG: hypothetical protein IIW36_04685 [Clostridia bacterium]|nr:hypothetical protein [Clostridia bacterium]MBQ5834092.1 hypothetical protein [Clostridia bacterium]